MSVFVIAEHDNQSLNPATVGCISAAKQIHENVTVLIAGFHAEHAAREAACLSGVTSVLWVDDPVLEHVLAENISELVLHMASDFSHIIAPADTFGKNLIPRIAARLDISPISDIIEVIDAETFIRPIYAGNALATVKVCEPIKILTIRPTAFDKQLEPQSEAHIEKVQASIDGSDKVQYINQRLSESERPDLGAARVVISGGRGLQSKENFAMIDALADCLGAAIGASRAAVDAGYVPNDYQVGQTGKVVAPELYIAIGISGAIQHLAGMKDSKVIVAINKDEEAPIFQIADYGLVGDLFKVVPELIEALKA